MKPSRIATILVVLAIFAILAVPAAAFHVAYDYVAYASDGDDITLMGDEYLIGQAHTHGDYTKSGGYGNYGTARFRASLKAATVSAYAHSHGVPVNIYYTAYGDGRVELIELMDRLIYTVAAGTYPAGVQVSITGWANGTITSEVGAGAHAGCWVAHGAEVFDTTLLTVGVAESGSIQVDEGFTLMQEIVAPGTTLLTATDYERVVRVQIYRGWAWAPGYNPGGGYVTGDGIVDFTNGLRVTAVNVPPGVTWTSESGQFLTAVAGAGDDRAAAPAPLLHQNQPNPFNPRTTIAFDLPRDCRVNLGIYDVSGRLVKTLLAGEAMTAGRRQRIWFGRDDAGAQVATGVYFYRLEADGAVETKAMTLMK